MSSADDESESGEEFTLWDIKDNLETEPCEVILKGGSPWGFSLTGGTEVRSPIQISEIAVNGKAEDSDRLRVGDYLLGVNGIKCVSQTEAVELIQGAFRTLTLTVWRGTSKLESSVKVLRSSSFLQKAREAQERERNRLGIQDDTIVQREAPASMKQRPRRIESFHGSRNRRQETPSGSSTERSIQSYHTADSKDVIGGTTIQDEKGNNPLPMEQATTPTAKVKEWPTVADLSQPKPILPNKYDGSHGYFNPLLSPSKSSPSLADKEVPYSTKNYPSPLMNKSSPNIHDDVKKSSVHSPSSSYSTNQKWSSPSAYQKNSPRQYHSNFYPVSSPFIKHNSNDYQNLQDIQQNIASTHATNYSLPPPIEKEECESELQGLTKGDNRPLCSPPAPPTRDISSLKYVPLSQQSHAKYPSWPVTQPSAEIESNESINAPLSIYNETNTSQNNVRALKDRNSPNSDRKASDRNASDPGFKKPIPFSVFLKRPDKKQAPYGTKVENDKKVTEAKMNEFFDSQPGYQQPIFDQDGHRIGDEKYNVSPPERESDGRFPSQQSIDPYENQYLSQQYRGYQDPKNSVRISRDSGSNPLLSPDRDSKPLFTDTKYSDGLISDNRYTDSSTSPLQSPKDNLPDNVHTSHYDPKSSYIVKTMVCYTTGTQTEFNSSKKVSPTSPRYNTRFHFDKSNQSSQTSPESTNRDAERRWSHSRQDDRPKSTSEKDKILLNNINSELDSNDQHSAPLMRKLARDLLANQSQESMNKRRSTSSSGGSGLRSPSSDYSHYFGELKESGSYSSVVIHDDLSEVDSAFSRPDGTYDSEKKHLHQFDNKPKNARRSFDPSMLTPKFNRSLQSSRYGSEAHLLSHSNKDHTSSMVNLPRSTRDETRARMSRPSTDSSTHSHRTGSSTDTFSSTGTNYSFDASTSPYVPPSPGQPSSRRESSDSVFSDVDKSPLEKKGDNFKDFKTSSAEKRPKGQPWVGRTQSMKKAYGTYDEMHHIHKRQESDVSSASSGEQFIHGRSQSETNYLPMDALRIKQSSDKALGSINEESSESRWQDALRRSQRSSQSSFDQNYTDLDVKKHVNEKLREYQTKTEIERSNLKRTSSEQFRPMKERLGNKTHSEPRSDEPKQQILPNKMIRTNSREKLAQSPSQSQSDLCQSGSDSKRMISPSSSRTDLRHSGLDTKQMISPSSSRSDLCQSGSDSKRLTSPSSSRTDLRSDSSDTRSDKRQSSPTQSRTELIGSREDIKRAQKYALQSFMLTKTGRLPSDEEEQQQSNGNTHHSNDNTHLNNGNTHHSNGNVPEPQIKPERPTRISVTESFRKKYAEGDKLRRSRSISSTDSGNYTEMRPPIRPQQTEWSRVRSQSRRPLSVGSDSSLVDPYAVTPITSLDHQRTPSDTTENVPQSPRTEQTPRNLQNTQSEDIQSPRMGSSSIYQNLMPEHSGYRKPPAPPPPTEDDKPPELPPRNYKHKESSQSDSQLLPPRQHQYQQPVEESHEKYVEQLRKFSRRYSEQQQAASMVYLSSKTQTHLSQSYPKPEVKSLEATSPMTSHSPSSSISSTPPFTSQQQPSYAANFTQSQPKNVSPKSSNNQSPSSSSFELDNEKHSESRHPQPAPRQSPPPRPPHPSQLQTPPRHPKSSQQQSPPRQEQQFTPPSLQHQLSSPEPPPPPTPIKDVEGFDQELPPPPPEVIEESERFSDDSYLAHKTKGDTRQIGTYKRSSTTGDVSKLSSETNNNKVIEKPPRKRLQKAWQPPTSQSESSGNEQDLDHGAVPRFSARETHVNPTVVKSVARPLEKNHIQQRPLGSSFSTSALLTPRPFTSTSEKDNQSHSAERPSVRDLKSCYENKSTPTRAPRHQDRFTSPKLIPRSPNNINNSPANKDLPNGFDSTRRLSNENFQQSDSVQDVSSDSDPSKFTSTRRTSFPPERTQVHYGGHSQERTKNVSNFNEEIQSPSQHKSPNDSYSVKQHQVSDNLSYSHKSFNSSHPEYAKHSVDQTSGYSAKDQDISTQSCHVRQRSQEELECDQKVSEIVKQDKSLIQVLQVDNKGRMDFMNGLFPLDEPVRHHSPQSSIVIEDKRTEKEEPKSPIDPSSLPADYFKSSPKAKIEMDMRGKSEELNQEFCNQDPDSLMKTKEELVKSIQKKVEKLKEGKAELQKELDEIDDVRHKLDDVVQKKCRTQQEKDKFTSYVIDMEKIIKLLLKLSGLLARAENALQSLPENSSPSVKKLAIDKRDRLQDQHEEAKSLKDDIDKRSAQVASFLHNCLTEAEYEDYKYFVQMKSKLTIEMQEFEDKITLGQEQILGLKRNIPGK